MKGTPRVVDGLIMSHLPMAILAGVRRRWDTRNQSRWILWKMQGTSAGLLCHAGKVFGFDGGARFEERDEGIVGSVMWRRGAVVGGPGVGGDGLSLGVGGDFSVGIEVHDAHDGDLVGGAGFFVQRLLGADGFEELLHHSGLDVGDARDVVVAIAGEAVRAAAGVGERVRGERRTAKANRQDAMRMEGFLCGNHVMRGGWDYEGVAKLGGFGRDWFAQVDSSSARMPTLATRRLSRRWVTGFVVRFQV